MNRIETIADEPPELAAVRRMAFFDSLPREIRRAIANSDCLSAQWQTICERGMRLGHKPKTIIAKLTEKSAVAKMRNPAERELIDDILGKDFTL